MEKKIRPKIKYAFLEEERGMEIFIAIYKEEKHLLTYDEIDEAVHNFMADLLVEFDYVISVGVDCNISPHLRKVRDSSLMKNKWDTKHESLTKDIVSLLTKEKGDWDTNDQLIILISSMLAVIKLFMEGNKETVAEKVEFLKVIDETISETINDFIQVMLKGKNPNLEYAPWSGL